MYKRNIKECRGCGNDTLLFIDNIKSIEGIDCELYRCSICTSEVYRAIN